MKKHLLSLILLGTCANGFASSASMDPHYNPATHKVVPAHAHVVADDGSEAVYSRATHVAVPRQELSALRNKEFALSAELTGALAFADTLKSAPAPLAAYLATPGKTLLGSLAAGEFTPWAEDQTISNIASLKAGIAAELTGIEIQAVNDAALFAILDGADSADKRALLAALRADADRKDAVAGDTSGTAALADLTTQLAIRTFLKEVE
jgi:hypothetical protein